MKKTWILLLILCGFAMAQRPYNNQRSGYAQNILWRDLHPSTQDSIRAAIADSLAALSADGVTIVNSSGTFKNNVVTSIAALEALSALDVGATVNYKPTDIRQAGVFEYADSTDLKAVLGYAVPDSAIIFASPTTDRVWFRSEVRNGFLNPYWYGAKGDGSTDDTDEIQKMVTAAGKYKKKKYFPAGTYIISSTIVDSNYADLGTVGGESFNWVGDGARVSILKANTDIQLLNITENVSSGANYGIAGINIQGLSFRGPGTGTSTQAAVKLDTTGTTLIDRCSFDGWKYGVYLNQSTTYEITGSGFVNNWAHIWATNQTNPGVINNCQLGASDSIGVYYDSGRLLTLEHSELTGHKIGVYITGSNTNLTINECNFENHETTPLYVAGGSYINVINTVFYRGTGSQSLNAVGTILATAGYLSLVNTRYQSFDMSIAENHVRVDNASARVKVYDWSRIPGDGVRIWDNVNDRHYYQDMFTIREIASVFGADSLTRGLIQKGLADDGSTADNLFYTVRTDDNDKYARVPLVQEYGTKYSTNGGVWNDLPARTEHWVGEKNFTRNTSADSTIVWIKLGFTPQRIIAPISSVRYDNWIAEGWESWYKTSNADTLFFIVKHTGAGAPPGTLSYLLYNVYLQKPTTEY